MYQTHTRHWSSVTGPRHPRVFRREDGLAPARGLLIGTALGAVLWAGIIRMVIHLFG